jgi:hypothetical protein
LIGAAENIPALRMEDGFSGVDCAPVAANPDDAATGGSENGTLPNGALPASGSDLRSTKTSWGITGDGISNNGRFRPRHGTPEWQCMQ